MEKDRLDCSKKLGGEELKKRIVVVVSAVLVVVTLVAIWQFSAQDAGESSALSGKLAQWVAGMPWLAKFTDLDMLDHILRKLAHGSIYLVLGLGLTGIVITQKTKRIMWLVPLMGMLLAVVDEFHQSFVPGRGPSARDVLIDTVGVCLGMLLMLLCKNCYRWWRRRVFQKS